MKHVLMTALAFALLIALPGAAADQAHNRYNVLFIAVDDLRPELGCYGVDYVKTPNIDRLAKDGIVFKQHFVCVPTCGASRYAMLTGRSPVSSGVSNNNEALYSGKTALSQDEQPGAQSMPELFRRSGYHTVLLGKISHTGDGKVFEYNGSGDGRPELPGAWDDYATPYGPWQRGWGVFFAYADGKHREDGKGNKDLMQFTVDKDTDLPDGLMAQTAIDKLKELKDRKQPFFMGLGFFKPHLPFVAPKQDFEAVKSWPIPQPALREGIDSQYANKASSEFYKYKLPFEKTKPLSPDDTLTSRRAYLACVRYTDRQVGKVLDALDELGLADNTIVVLWGDHGWFLGEGAQWGKHSALETALRSPLILRAPGVGKPGQVTDSITSTLDIYPTLVDLCKPSFTKTNWPLDGMSLVPVVTGAKPAVRDVALSMWGSATSIRSADYRLIMKNKSGPESVELFDLHAKDGELINVADKQPKVVKQMLEQMPK